MQLQQARAVDLDSGMGIRNVPSGQRHSFGHPSADTRHPSDLVRRSRRRQHVLAPDHTVAARPGLQRCEIDMQILGELADGRRCARPIAGRPPGRVHRVVGAVAHQYGVTALRLGAFGLEAHQHRADRQHVADVAAAFDDAAGVRAWDLNFGFRRLERAQRLVEFHHIAHLDAPGRQRRVLEALAEIRHQKRLDAHGAPRTFPTQSSSRSGPGSQNFSSRAGGYGVSKPVARNTGASRS